MDSIFSLDISCRGIFSLGSIPKCLNLCILDLSSNHVSSVGELAVLTSLEHLDLSHNSVSQLDGLQSLENLSRLELAGNKISNFDTLLVLSSLCKLQHLTLQRSLQSADPPHSVHLSNPVCRDPTYATAVAELFPTLVWLDKEPVKDTMPGKKFYDQCRAIEERCGQPREVQSVNPLADLPALKDPLEESCDQADRDSEQRIHSLLVECTDTSCKVQKLVSDVKNKLKLPSRTA